MIIGLSGYARTGKDTVAEVLAEMGWQRRAFADTLRKMVYALDPYVTGNLRVADLVDSVGWEEAKVGYPEVRRLLQRMGTEAGRQVLGEDVWVRTTLSSLSVGNYVITDCRFRNEADAIRAAGGQIWRIRRPGFGAVNAHSSERSLDNYFFDFYLDNEGTIDELRTVVTDYLLAANE
jgi:hypothetical protein